MVHLFRRVLWALIRLTDPTRPHRNPRRLPSPPYPRRTRGRNSGPLAIKTLPVRITAPATAQEAPAPPVEAPAAVEPDPASTGRRSWRVSQS